MSIISVTDLTARPPRSPRLRLGGYVILPRMLDKGRAEHAGTNGEYHFNCPLDQHFINFVGIDPIAMKAELANGKGDGEMLEWVQANAKFPRSGWEIAQWSAYQDTRVPSSTEAREYVNESLKKTAPKRDDINGWFDWLDVDDFVSFGGKV